MILCNKCNQVTAQIVTKSEFKKLSKTHYSGALAATATTVAAVAAKSGAIPRAVGVITHAVRAGAKAATKDPRALLITAGIGVAATLLTAGANHWLSGRKANATTYIY